MDDDEEDYPQDIEPPTEPVVVGPSGECYWYVETTPAEQWMPDGNDDIIDWEDHLRLSSRPEHRDRNVFGVALQCHPNLDTIRVHVNGAVQDDYTYDYEQRTLWVPDIRPSCLYLIQYQSETWEQRTRRLLNNEDRHGDV